MVQLDSDKYNNHSATITYNNSDMIHMMDDSITTTYNSFVDLNALKIYDKKIKEYIDEKINKTSLTITESKSNKYKTIYGED